MTYTPYRDIPNKIATKEPFAGNSMSAYIGAKGDYHILSYATEIGRITTAGEAFIGDGKYSRTTSRQQKEMLIGMDMSGLTVTKISPAPWNQMLQL